MLYTLFLCVSAFCVEFGCVENSSDLGTICYARERQWALCGDGVFSEVGKDHEVEQDRQDLRSAHQFAALCVNADYYGKESATGRVIEAIFFSWEEEVRVMCGLAQYLKHSYPKALFVSCLSGGLSIASVARSEGIDVSLGLLTTRHVIDQADTMFDQESFCLEALHNHDHDHTIVLWDDIAQSGKTMAVFYFQAFKNAEEIKLPPDTRFVFVANFVTSAKDTHPDQVGESRFARFVRKLVDLDEGYHADRELEVPRRDVLFKKWYEHAKAHVREFVCGVDTHTRLPILSSEGGNYLMDCKPDVRDWDRRRSLRDDRRRSLRDIDVLLGAPDVLQDKDFRDYCMRSSLLWHSFDETRNNVGYVYISPAGCVMRKIKNKSDTKDKALVYILCKNEDLEEQQKTQDIVRKWASEHCKTLGYHSLEFLVCDTHYVTRPTLMLPGVELNPLRYDRVTVLYRCAEDEGKPV